MEQDISLGAVKVRQVRGRRTPDGTCRHRFYLGDSRTGSVAVGRCQLCGTQRAFANEFGRAIAKGADRATVLRSWIAQGRAVREVLG